MCLEKSDPIAYRLYEKMKAGASRRIPPTLEELHMAAGLPPLDINDATILKSNLKLLGLGMHLEEDESLHPSMLVRLF